MKASRTQPKLFAVDLDGTLLDTRGKPHERDLRALKVLAERGVHVSIVTGRLYSGTRPAAQAVGVRGPLACVDGSHVVHAETHETLVHHGVRGEHASSIRAVFSRRHLATFVFARDLIVHDEPGEPFLGYVTTWSMHVERADRACDHPCWNDAEGVTALVAIGTGHQIEGTVAEVARAVGDAVQIASFPVRRLPGMWGMVLRAAGGSKGSALQWLAAHHGLELEETVCVGDWFNDVPMFAVAGRSYAMGHAPDDVKKAATHVLEETFERGGGVARAAEEAFGVRVD